MRIGTKSPFLISRHRSSLNAKKLIELLRPPQIIQTITMNEKMTLGAKAFAVFSNQINNEIAQENRELTKNIARLHPLREFLNRMEIRLDGTLIASCGFDSASVDECSHCDCGQKVASWRIAGLKPRSVLLRDAVRKKRGLKLIVAGQRVGNFSVYSPLFSILSLSPFVCDCHLISDGSGHSIYGRMFNLSKGDVKLLMDLAAEHPPNDEFLVDEGSLSAISMFTPCFISVDVTSDMSRSFHILRQKIDLPGSVDDLKLRRLCMAVMKDHQGTHRLEDNFKLRSNNNILTSIREKIRQVSIKLKHASIHFKLNAGTSGTCKNGKGAQWNICLKKNDCHSCHSTPVDDIISLRIIVSGVELGVESYHYSQGTFVVVFENRVRLFGTIKSDGGSNVDLLSQSFQARLYDSLNNPSDERIFLHLRLCLDNIWFDYSTVKEAIGLLDISDVNEAIELLDISDSGEEE